MNEKWKSHFVCRHKWLREWIEKCNCHMEPRFLRMQNRVYLWVYWTKSKLNQMQHFYSFTSANRIFKCANVPFLFVFESNDGVLLSLNVFFFFFWVVCAIQFQCAGNYPEWWHSLYHYGYGTAERRSTIVSTTLPCFYFSFSYDFRFAWKKSMPNKADAIQVTRACVMPYFRSLSDLAHGTAFGMGRFPNFSLRRGKNTRFCVISIMTQ